MEFHEGVRVEQTKVGLGVFAVREFFPNEVIGRVHGSIIDDPLHESDYCMELTEDLGLEPAAPFRFINHSCSPNSQLVVVESTDEDGPAASAEIWVEAISRIDPGEQLTIDYAWPAEAAIPCRCRSSQCRGWIVAEEERHYLHPAHTTDLPNAPQTATTVAPVPR